MTGSRLLLIAGLVGCLAACSGPDPAILHVEQIIGDLEVQRLRSGVVALPQLRGVGAEPAGGARLAPRHGP